MRITYFHSIDTYYLHDREMYVKRWMFLYLPDDYLASLIGVEHMDREKRSALFRYLAQEKERKDATVVF